MIDLSVPTAKALLKFASSNKNQPNLYGIGVTRQGLAATDGFATVEFICPDSLLDMVHEKYTGRIIDRKVFETSMKLAAVTKSWMTINPEHFVQDQLSFPDIASITPSKTQPGLLGEQYTEEQVRIDPQYLTLLHLVAVACETESIILSSVKRAQPLRFDVQGGVLSAIVVINQL